MTSQEFGDHIQAARIKAGLTQTQLADQAGVAYSTVAKIERGAIQHPSFFTALRLAQALELSLDDLAGKSTHPGAKAFHRGSHKDEADVKMVYCDVNGVLVRFFQRAFTSIGEETGIEVSRVEEAFWHFNDVVSTSQIPLSEFNKLFGNKLGVGPIDWTKHYMDGVEPVIPMHDFLKEVVKHYKVGLLTNIFPGFITQMRQHKLIPDIPYTAIVDSSEVKAVKPEKKMYEVAEQRSGYHGQEILFIDDTQANLIAAAKFHWRVMWFDDFAIEESEAKMRKILKL